jgi:EAL domain-containing protein (putative c-di-GMP-specific phosphodiesterase class I)
MLRFPARTGRMATRPPWKQTVFQPILRLTPWGEEFYGYECLMRAEVAGQSVSPVEILDLARGTGLLFQLDLAARRSSLIAAQEQRVAQMIFVNFSPNSIYNPQTCLDSTVRQVDALGLDRRQVVFEITEGERLPKMAHLRRIVDYYHDQGFGVALDDVGSGYSSLNVLLELRPDYAKLDMGLTRGVHTDPSRALVTGKLLETLQGLGIASVAEGVETAEELEWMRSHGADFVQGYYFARPSPLPPLCPEMDFAGSAP